MNLGRGKLGDTISFPLLVATTGGVATNAASTPTFSIIGADFTANLISNKTMLKNNAVAAVTGMYYGQQNLRAASGFAAGYGYSVYFRYTAAGAARRQTGIIFVD